MAKHMKTAQDYTLDYNYAKNRDFARVVMDNLLSLFEEVKTNRKDRQTVWQDSYRCWSVDRTQADKMYDGMADLQIPQIRKDVETMSRRLYKGLFPEDYLEAEPEEFVPDELVTLNTQLVRHYLDNVIGAKSVFMPWLKQNVLYGTSPLRQWWHKETNDLFFHKRVPVVRPNGEIVFKRQPVCEKIVIYNAPKLRAEDLFNTWVYPYNSPTPREIEINFFRIPITRHALKEKAKAGMCVGFDEFKDAGKERMEAFEESQERLAQFGETGAFLAVQNNTYFELLEIWCKLVLPGGSVPVPCVVEIVNGTYCTRIQRNPYWFQAAPVDWARFILPPPGEFYGRGLPEAAISLQHQLNDTMNQTMDSTTLALNNITIINPAYAPHSESFEMEPGAKWYADPGAVKQFSFPDLSETGYRAAQILRGMISEMSDNQPQLPDPIAGKARSTGQAQLAINEWQTDLFVFIDMIAEEALAPMASKMHSQIEQNIEDDDIIKIKGRYAQTWVERIVEPQDIVGRYKFKWLGSLQVENQAVKVQQILQLIKIWPQIPPEAQSQARLIWDNLLIKLFRDGFQIRDVHNIIETARLKPSVPPSLEEKILNRGGNIKVEPGDNDELHIRIHEMAQQQEKNPLIRALRDRHIMEHKAQLQKKQAEAQMQAQMQQMAMAQLQGENRSQPRPPGNTSQLSEATDAADLERGMRLGN